MIQILVDAGKSNSSAAMALLASVGSLLSLSLPGQYVAAVTSAVDFGFEMITPLTTHLQIPPMDERKVAIATVEKVFGSHTSDGRVVERKRC